MTVKDSRDNFTNLKTALDTAKSEISDLESKAVLKSALTGDSLSNDGGGTVIQDFELKDMSETRIAKGTTSGTVTFDYEEGPYATSTTSGSVTFAFSNFPKWQSRHTSCRNKCCKRCAYNDIAKCSRYW